MKRFIILMFMVLIVAFPSYASTATTAESTTASTNDTKQIPAKPSVNEEYYQYYAIFYHKYDKEYYLIYSSTPIVCAKTGNSYLGFVWNPDTSDEWVQLSSVTSSYALWGNITYLSGNGDVMDSDGETVKYQATDDSVFTEHAKANFSAYSDYWNNSGGDDGNSSGIISGLRSVVNAISSLPSKIGNAILDILKTLFIPSDGYLEEKINYLVERFTVAFGVTPYDMSSMFSSEKALSDITVSMYGSTVTIVKMDYVIDALAVFRKIIRGFICLLLLFYNINQFLGFIGQAPITLGALIGIKNHMEHSGDT